MKYFLLAIAIVITTMCIGPVGFDEGIAVEIANWRGNTSGAITLSFDDGYIETYNTVMPILDEKDVKASFNVISAKVGGKYGRLTLADWEHWEDAASKGHEIASHMATHVHVDEISGEALDDELESSKREIKENVGMEAVSFVYPGGAYDPRSTAVVERYFLSARTSDDGFNKAVPADLHLLKSKTAVDYAVSSMKRLADMAEADDAWLIENLHLVGDSNPTGYSFYLSTKDFESHLDYLISKDLWIAPQGDVARYIVERENSVARLSFPVFRRDSFSITLSNNLDGPVFNVPLTLIVTLPEGWDAVQVSGWGVILPAKISKGDRKSVV